MDFFSGPAWTGDFTAAVIQAFEWDYAAQEKATRARAELKAATLAALDAGMTEVEAADLAGVTRMTIRTWANR